MRELSVRWVLAVGLVLAGGGVWTGCGDGGEEGDVEQVRKEIRELARQGSAARPQIERMLEDPRSDVRIEAAMAYPRVAQETPAKAAPTLVTSAPALARVAKADSDANVRAAAVTALGHMRAMDEMETLLAAMEEDPDPLVRRRAANAVSRILGVSYDIARATTPEQRRAIVNDARDLWSTHSDYLRKYHGDKYQHPRR